MSSETAVLRALGNRIRELRQGRSFSQERFAERAAIHENHVRRIELGRANPTVLVLLRIARALGVSAADLLEDLK